MALTLCGYGGRGEGGGGWGEFVWGGGMGGGLVGRVGWTCVGVLGEGWRCGYADVGGELMCG